MYLSGLLLFLARQHIGQRIHGDTQSGRIVQQRRCGRCENAQSTQRNQTAIESQNEPLVPVNAPVKPDSFSAQEKSTIKMEIARVTLRVSR